MPRERATPPIQPLICLGNVTAWDAWVSLCGSGTRSMTLKVSLIDLIKGRSSAVINVFEQKAPPQQPGCSPSVEVGARVMRITKDDVHVYATVTSTTMSTLLALASSNRLNSCLLACHEPYRGQADVISLDIGTDAHEVRDETV